MINIKKINKANVAVEINNPNQKDMKGKIENRFDGWILMTHCFKNETNKLMINFIFFYELDKIKTKFNI